MSTGDVNMTSWHHTKPVGITAKFIVPKINDSIRHDFDASNCKEHTLGMDNPSKPLAGDYSYSGMHDHGLLVAPKEGGDFALLIGCVHEAKRMSDELLTRIIEEERQVINKKRDSSIISQN